MCPTGIEGDNAKLFEDDGNDYFAQVAMKDGTNILIQRASKGDAYECVNFLAEPNPPDIKKIIVENHPDRDPLLICLDFIATASVSCFPRQKIEFDA